MNLTPAMKKFIVHWGEMGSRWGINRTVAQIHALLYISPDPLNAEEITHALSIARSNVSSSLKELLGWGIVKVVHKFGDRKDYFQCMEDVWEMFVIILDERKKREIDPTIAILRDCVQDTAKDKGEAFTHKRLLGFLNFFETMYSWYEQMRKLPLGKIIQMVGGRKKVKIPG